MNKKLVTKFIILALVLTIVYQFLAGIASGIFSAFFEDMNFTDYTQYINQLLALLMVWPGIVTAARITYKGKNLSINEPKRVAISYLLVAIILNFIIFFVFQKKGEFQDWVFMFIDLILVYFLSSYYIRKNVSV